MLFMSCNTLCPIFYHYSLCGLAQLIDTHNRHSRFQPGMGWVMCIHLLRQTNQSSRRNLSTCEENSSDESLRVLLGHRRHSQASGSECLARALPGQIEGSVLRDGQIVFHSRLHPVPVVPWKQAWMHCSVGNLIRCPACNQRRNWQQLSIFQHVPI
ncbi:hypothetical protein CEXT_430411 [Caerostris extrusa]|uniref:Uncharacterized protein n=1 Tax=Caerostris extrusa TaxID=172846 RepID=A0AAV4XML8_CAEEX|nr:hypothetical protein CEXT_430411 [Caerostris extrusa]